MLTGNEINNARSDETSVPYIKGRAPNFSVTGFHSDEKINPNPNFSILSEESKKISTAINITSAIRRRANNNVIFSKIISPAFFLLFISFLRLSVLILIFNIRNFYICFLDYFIRQRSIAKIFGKFFSVTQSPLKKFFHCLSF